MEQVRSRWWVALLVGGSLVGVGVAGLPSPSSAASKGHKRFGRPHGVVVHVGDSFVNAGLQQNLRPRFHAMGTGYVARGKTFATLSSWALGHELSDLYWSYRPALILITLGANDLLYHPAKRRAYQVHRLVRQTHGTPCVWISTPLWKGAPSEFVEMIRVESKPCRHFDSNTLATRISRQKDGRHPDEAGGKLWADAFWKWLMENRDPERGFWALQPAPKEEHAPRPPIDPWKSAEP